MFELFDSNHSEEKSAYLKKGDQSVIHYSEPEGNNSSVAMEEMDFSPCSSQMLTVAIEGGNKNPRGHALCEAEESIGEERKHLTDYLAAERLISSHREAQTGRALESSGREPLTPRTSRYYPNARPVMRIEEEDALDLREDVVESDEGAIREVKCINDANTPISSTKYSALTGDKRNQNS